MQYVLTKEEYESLVPKKEKEDRDEALEWTRITIAKLSGAPCELPEEERQFGMCSSCLISDVGDGFHDDDDDEDESRPSSKVSDLVCRRSRHYPK